MRHGRESIHLGPMVVGCALAGLLLRARRGDGWAVMFAAALLFSVSGHYEMPLDLTAHLPVPDRQRCFEKLVLWACIGMLVLVSLGAGAQRDGGQEPMPGHGAGCSARASLLLLGF